MSTAPLVAALGAAGLAIGLSLQGSLSNLAWGVLLIMFRPFRVGDFVTAGGIEGTVDSINLMHTLLVMPDGREAIVPNAKVGSDAILNYNRRGTRRFELKVGIGYKDDIGAAMAEIKKLFEQDARILKDPAPGVWTSGLGESSVDLVVRAWTVPADFWADQDRPAARHQGTLRQGRHQHSVPAARTDRDPGQPAGRRVEKGADVQRRRLGCRPRRAR